jgi:hypothetical protein
MAKPKNPNGVVIYRGPSMLDGQPIVAIATGLNNGSSNDKTGNMVQTWILREDISPTDACHTGEDASICGNCPFRGTVQNGRNVGRACYVNVFMSPTQVWKSYANGNGIYPTVPVERLAKTFANRIVRLGSYGDPAAVPLAVWEALLSRTAGHTGYTHQWRDFPELAAYVMASADSSADRAAAKMLGFRTFRVTGNDSRIDREEREIICPASAEKNYVADCKACKACGGTSAKAKADVVITVHGSPPKLKGYRSLKFAA